MISSLQCRSAGFAGFRNPDKQMQKSSQASCAVNLHKHHPFAGSAAAASALNIRDPKKDPNFDNHPCRYEGL